jgi:phage terminase small subunit
MADRKLAAQQLRFVDEYLLDLNAAQAAIRAGYSARTAYTVGPRLLRDPRIAAAVSAAQAARSERTGITADRVLGELNRLAFDLAQEAKDRIKCLELLGKHLKLFTDKLEHSGKLDVVAGVVVLPAEQD